MKNRAKEQTAKKIQIRKSKSTQEQSCQSYFGTIVTVTLGNNRASATWKQSCQCVVGTIVPVSLGNHCASVTWEPLCQCHLGTIMPVSLVKNCASFTWNNLASSIWKLILINLSYFQLKTK